MATLTIYPDAGSGNTSADGPIQVFGAATWAAARTASSGTAYPTTNHIFVMQVYRNSDSTAYNLVRSIFTFDTSNGGLNPLVGATINSATFSFYGISKNDGAGNAYDTILVLSTPATDDDVVDGDFDQVSATLYSAVKTYADFSTSGYNDYALNAAGLAGIDRTGVTCLGLRNKNYDIDNVQPAASEGPPTSARTDGYFADQTGTTNDPKLVIDYTPAATGYGQVI